VEAPLNRLPGFVVTVLPRAGLEAVFGRDAVIVTAEPLPEQCPVRCAVDTALKPLELIARDACRNREPAVKGSWDAA